MFIFTSPATKKIYHSKTSPATNSFKSKSKKLHQSFLYTCEILNYLYFLVTMVVESFVVPFNQILSFVYITETPNSSSQTIASNCWISPRKCNIIYFILLHFQLHHITANTMTTHLAISSSDHRSSSSDFMQRNMTFVPHRT